MAFQRGSNPVWFLVDLTAHAFDDTFYMFVLQNQIPYLPATVYHEPDGVPWNQPIQFLANGTLPIDIFWDTGTTDNPTLYRLEFRHGSTQADPLIYLVENYSPGLPGGGDITTFSLAMDNQITNPQFPITNFGTTVTITATDPEIEIAPGWKFVASGSGTVVLTQVPLNSSVPTPTNAPYALQIDQNGFTLPKLRQRFDQNGVNWANKTVSSSITARMDGVLQEISVDLIDSNGTIIGQILDITPLSAVFEEYLGFDTLPASTNPDLPPAAYIDYVLNLPENSDVFVTSIQIIVQDVATNVTYQQDSIERQIDHTFHYYKDPLIVKPISSMLVGWDFAFNPAQFFGYTVAPQAVGANKSYYAWDQTIVFQTVNSAVTVSKRDVDQSIVLTATIACQLAIVQYLSAAQAKSLFLTMFEQGISAHVEMASSAVVPVTISLWWTDNVSLPDMTINNSLVTGLGSNGLPAVVGGWTQITRDILQANVFENSSINNMEEFGFPNFDDIEPYANQATFFAIVVGTSQLAMNGIVEFKSISVVPGSIPTIPAPQTPDEVLRECQYYYEKSYESATVAGTIVDAGIKMISQDVVIQAGNVTTLNTAFELRFNSLKISSAATVHLYNPVTGIIDTVRSFVQTNTNTGFGNNLVTNFWVPLGLSNKGVTYIPAGSETLATVATGGASRYTGYMYYHYTVDSRLGIV